MYYIEASVNFVLSLLKRKEQYLRYFDVLILNLYTFYRSNSIRFSVAFTAEFESFFL